MDSNNDKSLREAVIEELESVYDPEIPVNIFALGLVYEVKVDGGRVVAHGGKTKNRSPRRCH
jgi:metal-sulfur cluster biosynthetic enzyme